MDSVKYAGKTLLKHLLQRATSSFSVAIKTDTSMELDFSFTKTVNAIMGCRPVSSRLITIRMKALAFNTPIIRADAPTTDYYDDDIEDFYDQLQEVIDQEPKKDIFLVQGDWNAKIGEDANKNWKGTFGQYCNPETKERGLRLLEFAIYNNLKGRSYSKIKGQ